MYGTVEEANHPRSLKLAAVLVSVLHKNHLHRLID